MDARNTKIMNDATQVLSFTQETYTALMARFCADLVRQSQLMDTGAQSSWDDVRTLARRFGVRMGTIIVMGEDAPAHGFVCYHIENEYAVGDSCMEYGGATA